MTTNQTDTPTTVPLDGRVGRHTPGPWTVDFYEDTGGFDVYTDSAWTASICGRGPWNHRKAESAANARLIVAAPELLDALRDLLAHAERANEIMLSEAGIGVCDISPIEKARAAIARAVDVTPNV